MVRHVPVRQDKVRRGLVWLGRHGKKEIDKKGSEKMAKKQEVTIITIPPLKKDVLEVKIIGDSHLITHAWSEKAKKEMLDKQMKKAKQGKEAKNPNRDYQESLYWLDKNNKLIKPKNADPNKHHLFGFKTIAFKAAAVKAANDVGLAMTFTRRSFHIVGEFVPIKCDKIVMREDMVRIGKKCVGSRVIPCR